MSSSYFRIKSSAALEEKMRDALRRLQKEQKAEGNPFDLENTIHKRPEGMPRLVYLRFRMLHRQFSGRKTLLPLTVRLARLILERFPRLKQKWRPQ